MMKYRGPMLRQGFAGQGGLNIAAYNPQGRTIGHTTETANKDKILIACNPDFSHSTHSAALRAGFCSLPSTRVARSGQAGQALPLEMTERIRAQDSNSGASSTLWF